MNTQALAHTVTTITEANLSFISCQVSTSLDVPASVLVAATSGSWLAAAAAPAPAPSPSSRMLDTAATVAAAAAMAAAVLPLLYEPEAPVAPAPPPAPPPALLLADAPTSHRGCWLAGLLAASVKLAEHSERLCTGACVIRLATVETLLAPWHWRATARVSVANMVAAVLISVCCVYVYVCTFQKRWQCEVDDATVATKLEHAMSRDYRLCRTA